MDGQGSNSLDLIFAIITVGMILLALGIISAVFLYQQKLQKRKEQMKNLEIDYQKDLVNSSIEAREMEQRRIALELHDDVGSTLTAIKFSISSAPIDNEVKTLLNENLMEAIQKVRRISNELLPSILEELGLLAASTSLVTKLNEQIHPIQFSIQSVQDPSSSLQTKEVNLAIYRVLQELLNNIVKYSGATEVSVRIHQDENGVELTVEDNGSGFVPEDHKDRAKPTLGLKNMEIRIQQINGSMRYSKLKQGTRVNVEWKAKKI